MALESRVDESWLGQAPAECNCTVRTGRCHCWSTKEKGGISLGMCAETIDYIRYMQ